MDHRDVSFTRPIPNLSFQMVWDEKALNVRSYRYWSLVLACNQIQKDVTGTTHSRRCRKEWVQLVL